MLRESLRYNLGRLMSFSGREAREVFWPYAGCVSGLTQMFFILAMLPAMLGKFAPESPVYVMAVAIVAAIVLLAAAIVRRLHDCGRSGFWALVPLPFLSVGFVLMSRQFQSTGEPDLRLFFTVFANNFVYVILLGVLILQLSRPGRRTTNRFGAAPETPADRRRRG
jgi:uncharacterized membrane protein YhaH (DUF805 family)